MARPEPPPSEFHLSEAEPTVTLRPATCAAIACDETKRCMSASGTHSFAVQSSPATHHSGSLITSISTFSAPASDASSGSSALSIYDCVASASVMSAALVDDAPSRLHMSNDQRQSWTTTECDAATDTRSCRLES